MRSRRSPPRNLDGMATAATVKSRRSMRSIRPTHTDLFTGDQEIRRNRRQEVQGIPFKRIFLISYSPAAPALLISCKETRDRPRYFLEAGVSAIGVTFPAFALLKAGIVVAPRLSKPSFASPSSFSISSRTFICVSVGL